MWLASLTRRFLSLHIHKAPSNKRQRKPVLCIHIRSLPIYTLHHRLPDKRIEWVWSINLKTQHKIRRQKRKTKSWTIIGSGISSKTSYLNCISVTQIVLPNALRTLFQNYQTYIQSLLQDLYFFQRVFGGNKRIVKKKWNRNRYNFISSCIRL